MIIRRKHNSAFTVVPNAIAADQRLSIGARWLMTYLLSKPDDWIVRAGDIMRVADIGKYKAYALVKECIAAGYIRREKHGDGSINYEVRDEANRPVPENQDQATHPVPENPDQDNPDPKNRDTYKELTSLLRTENYKKRENGFREEKREGQRPVVWIVEDDPYWTALADRREKETGKRPYPTGSKNATGQGYYFPIDWIAEARAN